MSSAKTMTTFGRVGSAANAVAATANSTIAARTGRIIGNSVLWQWQPLVGLFLAGTVVERQRFLLQSLQVVDARLVTGVGGHPRRRGAAAVFCHALPQLDGVLGVMAGCGHQDKADAVGLGLVLATK